MTKRKPMFGDFYVSHAEPSEVYQIDAVMDGKVRFHGRLTGKTFDEAMDDFLAFYTRCPI